MKAKNKDKELLYELRLDTKSLDDEAGTFEGYLSVYGRPDRQRDVVEPGAWRLARNPLPLLFRHDRNQLIGAIDQLNETERGLFIKGHLNLAVARAREIYALMKDGLITGLSPGYNETKDSFVGDIRHILGADLHEASLTPFPANAEAVISSFKEAGEDYYMTAKDLVDPNESLGEEPTYYIKSIQAAGLPLADEGITWDAGAARQDLNKWAGEDMGKYSKAFLYYDGSGNKTGCKLPIATIIDGKLTAVPAAIHAAKSRFNGTQGIPANEKARIEEILASYSKKLGWNNEADNVDKGADGEEETKGKEEVSSKEETVKQATDPEADTSKPQSGANPNGTPPEPETKPMTEEIKKEEPKPDEIKLEEPKPEASQALNAEEIKELETQTKEFQESLKSLNELFTTRIKEYTDDGKTTPNDDKNTP